MHTTLQSAMLVGWLVNPNFAFLGSGPKGVDDLSFHTYGEFSPPSSPLSVHPSPHLKAKIPALRPKFQPQAQIPDSWQKIPALRSKIHPQSPNPSPRPKFKLRGPYYSPTGQNCSLEAEIPASRRRRRRKFLSFNHNLLT